MRNNGGFEEEKALARGNLKLLFFGNVRPYKGLDILIKALNHCPETELLVAGKIWGDRKDFQDQIEKYNLTSRVTFVDKYIPVEEFEKLFRGSDILVMPYRSGTGSIVPRLAMSFGLPVIASDVGSISESIVDGANGMIVTEITPERLASAVCALSQDRILLNKMKQQASATADPHGWENYVAACIGLLGNNEKDAAGEDAEGFADLLG
jgi:glycosyltransferase involved in cell wall biosynthesis